MVRASAFGLAGREFGAAGAAWCDSGGDDGVARQKA